MVIRSYRCGADLSVFGPELAADIMGVERYGFWLSTISVVIQLFLCLCGTNETSVFEFVFECIFFPSRSICWQAVQINCRLRRVFWIWLYRRVWLWVSIWVWHLTLSCNWLWWIAILNWHLRQSAELKFAPEEASGRIENSNNFLYLDAGIMGRPNISGFFLTLDACVSVWQQFQGEMRHPAILARLDELENGENAFACFHGFSFQCGFGIAQAVIFVFSVH